MRSGRRLTGVVVIQGSFHAQLRDEDHFGRRFDHGVRCFVECSDPGDDRTGVESSGGHEIQYRRRCRPGVHPADLVPHALQIHGLQRQRRRCSRAPGHTGAGAAWCGGRQCKITTRIQHAGIYGDREPFVPDGIPQRVQWRIHRDGTERCCEPEPLGILVDIDDALAAERDRRGERVQPD